MSVSAMAMLDAPKETDLDSEPPDRLQVKETKARVTSLDKPSRNVDEHVPAFLQAYGFAADNDISWRSQLRDRMPELRIQVVGHSSVCRHTHYRLTCELKRSGETTSWEKALRLTHLRSGLHDPVQQALGSSYPSYFAGVPFAHHMRPSGTTARLDSWCQRFAVCVTRRLVPPWVVAAALRLLGVPALDATDSDVDTSGLHAIKCLAGDCFSSAGTNGIARLYNRGPPSEAEATATTATPPAASAGASAAASDPDDDYVPPSPGSPCSSITDFEGCPVADLDDM